MAAARTLGRGIVLVAVGLAVAGCTPPATQAVAPAATAASFVVVAELPPPAASAASSPETAAVNSPGLEPMIRLALADAVRQTGKPAAELKVISAETVTWPDGSIGCPRPGMMYTQALVPGYRIRIQAGAARLDYHGSGTGEPALCPAGRARDPLPDRRV
jgi:hypothetical protein